LFTFNTRSLFKSEFAHLFCFSLLCKITTKRLKLCYFWTFGLSTSVNTLNMISVYAVLKRGRKPRSPQTCGIFTFFGCIKSTLWNWVTLQRYSPEQQEAQTCNRGSSNVIVNIRDLLQQIKDRGFNNLSEIQILFSLWFKIDTESSVFRSVFQSKLVHKIKRIHSNLYTGCA